MHRTHLPLTIWFWAIFLCATDKRGISAKGLARQLELSYESAWYLLVRIRRAMQEHDQGYLLSGMIEMDEAYLGAPKSGKKRGRGTERAKMAVAVSKDSLGRPKFLRQYRTNTSAYSDGSFPPEMRPKTLKYTKYSCGFTPFSDEKSLVRLSCRFARYCLKAPDDPQYNNQDAPKCG